MIWSLCGIEWNASETYHACIGSCNGASCRSTPLTLTAPTVAHALILHTLGRLSFDGFSLWAIALANHRLLLLLVQKESGFAGLLYVCLVRCLDDGVDLGELSRR